MQASTEIIPPTAVTHAVALSFLSSRSTNLVVAKTALLQIFNIKPVARPVRNGLPDQESTGDQQGILENKLVLVGEYPLAGVVTSLAKVKLLNSRSGGEVLLISSRDAKMSLVEWDPEAHSLNTISIHYYEGDGPGCDFFASDLSLYPTYTTVDPSGRCAALKFGQRSLAILPLRQSNDDFAAGEEENATSGVDKSAQPARTKKNTPYASSFVLPVTLLDSSLMHPVHLTFLHEYRDPTIGILSSPKDFAPHLNRKDSLAYSVFTLDIEGRARTPLLSVSGLPSDLFKVIALPLPVGGSLLIGSNQIVHVGQAGKTHGVGVNEYAKEMSSFAMTDQSELGLKLEHSKVVSLNTAAGDMLLVLNDGRLGVVSFKMDGRLVGGVSVRLVDPAKGGDLLKAYPTTVVSVNSETIFLGSDEADSVLLRCRGNEELTASTKSNSNTNDGADEDGDEPMDDEDDLYGDDVVDAPATASASVKSADDLSFSVDDILPSVVAAGESIYAPASRSLSIYGERENSQKTGSAASSSLEMILPITSNRQGKMKFLSRTLPYVTKEQLQSGIDVQDAWNIVVTTNSESGEMSTVEYTIITRLASDGTESSAILKHSSSGLEECSSTDFESTMGTRHAGVLGGGTRIVQVTSSELKVLDHELGLSQIIPMTDEETDSELTVQHTSFCDPYLLVIRNDSSAMLLKSDKRGEVEEVDRGDAFATTKWISGCIYGAQGNGPNAKPLIYMLSSTGGLHIFDAVKPTVALYSAESLAFCPYVLAPDRTERRTAAREQLRELLIAELGDANDRTPHMLIRTSSNEVIVYRPFHFPPTGPTQIFTKHLRWLKQPQSFKPTHDEDYESADDSNAGSKMRALNDLTGNGAYSGVFVAGFKPSVVVKEAASRHRIIPLCEDLRLLVPISRSSSRRDLMSIDYKNNLCRTSFELEPGFGQVGWHVKSWTMDAGLEHVCFHAESNSFAACFNTPTDFKLPEDDWHQEWATEDIQFKPTSSRGLLKLIDGATGKEIDSEQLEPDEQILVAKTMSLEFSEKTHERRSMIVLGTGVLRGEDLGVQGAIYVFEIIRCVPEPDRPETNRKLRRVVRGEVRGAVTALSETSAAGFVIAAQGQKCMVRGLKEDGSLLPIAFMDMQTHASVLKSLPGTGLTLMCDALKGVRFAGFSPDPFKLQLFGKSSPNMRIVAGDFLPDGKKLFLLVVDDKNDLQILQFDPENPASLSGTRLIHLSSFSLHDVPVSMSLVLMASQDTNTSTASEDVEMTDAPSAAQPQYLVHIIFRSGAHTVITAVNETTYRRLGALQAHLASALDHAAGLNPRAFRGVETYGVGFGVGRGVLDGGLLRRWLDLSAPRRAEMSGRVGVEGWVLKNELDGIAGAGAPW